jgi:hypothetical protein
MYEERRRFRAAQFWQDDNNGDFQYADTRSYEPIDCLAADDELLAFLSLLDDEEKEVLCAAIDNELSLAGAGMSLGKSGRKARAIAEWIRIKYSVYSGRTPDAGYMPTKVRRSA